MKRFCFLVILMVTTLILCSEANAGWLFGRRAAACSNGSCSPQMAMTAKVQRSTTTTTTVTSETATAQGVANIMARLGRVGHFGGHKWFEGCGSGPSPQAAYNICCYANSGLKTYDVGYARGANGMWYCCRRYRP